MKNADLFQKTFNGLYATELWCMEEENFLKWLNASTDEPTDKNNKSCWVDEQANRIALDTNGCVPVDAYCKRCTYQSELNGQGIRVIGYYCPRCGAKMY